MHFDRLTEGFLSPKAANAASGMIIAVVDL